MIPSGCVPEKKTDALLSTIYGFASSPLIQFLGQKLSGFHSLHFKVRSILQHKPYLQHDPTYSANPTYSTTLTLLAPGSASQELMALLAEPSPRVACCCLDLLSSICALPRGEDKAAPDLMDKRLCSALVNNPKPNPETQHVPYF